MITSQTAKELAKSYHEAKEKMFIEITENYLEGAVSRNIKDAAEKGLSNTIVYPSTQINKEFFKKTIEENGFTCEFRQNGSIKINW
jgi:hypothetical protein